MVVKYTCTIYLFEWAEEEGLEKVGRRKPTFAGYRPHITLSSAKLHPEMLGVVFRSDMVFGRNENVIFEPLYPDIDYSDIKKDCMFEVKEGRRMVAKGVVTHVEQIEHAENGDTNQRN